MNIGISGAQSTGKTTLVNELEYLGFNVFTLVARTVMKQHPINKDGDDGTQEAIIKMHLHNLDNAIGNCFMDRCLVDGLVFTLYGLKHNKVSWDCFSRVLSFFCDNINRYDYIVYLEPEFDIISDGVRDTDAAFRDELCEIYELVLKFINVPVIRPKGTTGERVQMILNKTGLFRG